MSPRKRPSCARNLRRQRRAFRPQLEILESWEMPGSALPLLEMLLFVSASVALLEGVRRKQSAADAGDLSIVGIDSLRVEERPSKLAVASPPMVSFLTAAQGETRTANSSASEPSDVPGLPSLFVDPLAAGSLDNLLSQIPTVRRGAIAPDSSSGNAAGMGGATPDMLSAGSGLQDSSPLPTGFGVIRTSTNQPSGAKDSKPASRSTPPAVPEQFVATGNPFFGDDRPSWTGAAGGNGANAGGGNAPQAGGGGDFFAAAAGGTGMLVVGPDAGHQPRVKVLNPLTGAEQFNILAYPASFRGGVRVAVGDVSGDGTPDIITGTGPGDGSRVRVFDGSNGNQLSGPIGSFNAYAVDQTDGIFVAAGDVNGDGFADIITGTEQGFPSRVKIFSGSDSSVLANFVADPAGPTSGVRVAAGDVNGDGKADIITGTGPGTTPRVSVFDGGTLAQLYSFFAFDTTFRGGVYVTAGDVTGDGMADVIASCGPGGSPWVRVFSGANTASAQTLLAYDAAFAGGVRVAVVDANLDGQLDIATAAGPNGKHVRIFDGKTQAQLSNLLPYGASFDKGLFVAADPRLGGGGGGILSSNPVVTVQATVADIIENGSTQGQFTFSRTGDTTNGLTISVSISGTATPGTDHNLNAIPVVIFGAGSATTTLNLTPTDDGLFEPSETVVATVQSGIGYDVGTPSVAVVSIWDDDGPPPIVPDESCGCGGEGELVATASGVRGNIAAETAEAGVRYGDGLFQLRSADLFSAGFGRLWGQDWGWSNKLGYANITTAGTGTVVCELPYLRQDTAGTVAAISNAAIARFFDYSFGSYTPRFFLKEQLTYDSGAGEYTLTDTAGNRIKFFDFSTSLPASKRGQMKSFTDPKGNVTTVTSYTTAGLPSEVQHSSTIGSTTITESYLYTYLTSGANSGRVSNVTLRRQTNGGSWSTVRQVDYTYYDGSQSFGNVGNLRTAVVKDAGGATIDSSYFRYYTSGESNGYVGGLKYAFGPQSYSRLAAAFADPFAATNAQVAPYADVYLEYDSVQRVKKQTVQGAGCSACTGGLGTFEFSYSTSEFPDGYNSWRRKTVETLPDGNQNIVYTNYAGEVMLHLFKEVSSGNIWATYYRYDSDGRLILRANPSAVSGYDETKADLLNNQLGNYQHLRDSAGLIETVSYYTSTTAGETTAGSVAGYQNETKLQRGETGTAILQSATQYFAHTGGSVTVHPIATTTVYRNTDGTGGQTTSYSYTWFSSSTQMESMTVTKPVITTAQNGPGTADTETIFVDTYGRPVWQKDGDGFLHYTAYDQASGGVAKTIVDVNTTQTSDFTGLPSGWSTPSGGGLHLKTLMEVDSLGRTTKLTDPNTNVTYTVFNDPNHEVRSYVGWQTGSNTPTGPTQVWREVRLHSTTYYETLTMSATPNVTDNRPTGTESISSVQTLSRSYVSAGGQVTRRDVYHNLAGVTYSTSLYIGTQNTNYYTTLIDFTHRGWQNRVQLPTGTIYRTVYDSLGRGKSSWVGTNDTGATASDPTGGGASGNNMIKTSENQYDGGGIGDSNLTQITQIPGGSAANRVTQFYYDWRNRQAASKSGVEGSESTSLNRLVFYTEFDNLSQPVASEQYDGDGVTIADANSDGVPDKPSSSLLRARSTTSFDEQGRVYRTQVYSVDQSSGSVSSSSLTTDVWFGRRGQVLKTAQPGGLVSKSAYDGAGRVTKSYLTDGGGDSAWSDADDVSGDAVLEQMEYSYDANSNVILVTSRQRFHDETATGELGNPTTAPKARVSYAASYYDAANRLTDSVSVGTNAGSSYTRPSSPPSRSDTVLVVSYAYNAAGWVETTTDPRAILHKTFYDNLGRTTKTVEAYVDGTPSNADDKTTEFTYDGSNHMLTLKAHLTGGAYQTTEWVYGVTTAAGSDFNCNECLAAMKYPDKSSGDPSNSEKETYTINALYERKTMTDRNGSVHTYSFDVVGRPTADAVTTLGSGVDGAIRRLETAYDTGGRAYLFTSYDAASAGNVVNQVQRGYNGLGQLITEYQASSGAVNTSSTPKVQYAYSEMASGANHSRQVSMTYPSPRTITYNYATGLASTISRLSSITDGSTTLESLDYLGLGTVVRRAHPQPGVDLTYIKQSGESNGDGGDQYTGLDRFGRIVDQRWIKTSDGSHTDRFKYGYDRNGNRLYEDNVVNSLFSELYHANGASAGYDLLNQLTDFRRGTLSDTNSDGVPDTVTTASRTQSWAFDPLGNWSTLTTDGTGQTRTHNKQNQITSISGLTTPTYDANGNTTGDENGKTLVYDAWNRLVAYKNGSTVLASYSHDALRRRITEGSSRVLYYSAEWQVLEERESGVVKVQHVWSPVYIDAMIERDRDADGNSGNGLEERLYVQHDANFNVSSLLSTSGAAQERYVYDPYGTPTFLNASWSTLSGSAFAWGYLHQGGRRDGVAGLYDFRRRILASGLGRWNEPKGQNCFPFAFCIQRRAANSYIYEANAPLRQLSVPGFALARGGRPQYRPPPPIAMPVCCIFCRPGTTDIDRKSCKVLELTIWGNPQDWMRGDPGYARDACVNAAKRYPWLKDLTYREARGGQCVPRCPELFPPPTDTRPRNDGPVHCQDKVDDFLYGPRPRNKTSGWEYECTVETKNGACCVESARQLQLLGYLECVRGISVDKVLQLLEATGTVLSEFCEKNRPGGIEPRRK